MLPATSENLADHATETTASARESLDRGLSTTRRGAIDPRMQLFEKGSFAPPPKLPRHAQSLSAELARWQSVHARTHWRLGDERVVDGADFYLGDDELGHLHLDGEAHVAVGAQLRTALVSAGFARPFRWSGDFVTARIDEASDVAHGAWLFALRYDALRGATEAELLARIASHVRAV